jgi:diguanylate cyclase (GGDEF)-like protein/PAS domain S-box-containing protein
MRPPRQLAASVLPPRRRPSPHQVSQCSASIASRAGRARATSTAPSSGGATHRIAIRNQVSSMDTRQKHPYQSGAGWILLALSVPLLWWVWHPARRVAIEPMTFVFWHSVVELFAVVVAFLVFVTGFRAMLSARKGAVVLLGIAFCGVGLLDFLHTMSYSGMPDAITPNTPHKSIFFWLAARMLAAVALLAYVALPAVPRLTVRAKRLALILMLALVGVVALVGLRWPERVPALFVDGHGLTPLKIGLEWLIVLVNLASLVVLWLRRLQLLDECVVALGFAAALSACSGLFFTMLGVVDKDAANAIGHLYKVAAYLYLFHATVNEALRRPLARMEIQHLREKLVLSSAPDGVLWVDEGGAILMVNPAMETLTGYCADELVGRNVDMFLPAHLRDTHAQSMRDYFAAPRLRAMGAVELKLLRRDGRLLPVDISLGHWEDEGSRHAIAYIRDLSERKLAHKEIRDSTQRLALHFQLTPLAVIEWDTNGYVLDWNPAAERIFGYAKSEALGLHATDLMPNSTKPHAAPAWASLLSGRDGARTTHENLTRDGRVIYCAWYNTQLVDPDGRVIGVTSLAQDATEQKIASERLSYLACFDDLTGLPNRTLFKDRLSQAFLEADRKAQQAAVLFLNIDRFQDVNETLGHEAGNLLLQATARRLQGCFRSTDTVARFGADEFAVILAEVAHVDDVTRVAQHIVDKFKEAIAIRGRGLFVTFGMGIALYPVDAADVDTILRNANSAMYSAKGVGRNSYQFYSAAMTERATRQLALQTGLRSALDNGELLLHYQPQVDCGTGRIVGVEALLRWRHPDEGMVSPAQFIPVAEETGLIVPIGEWVLRTACLQAKAWQEQGLAPMRTAVNLSARQFKDPRFARRVLEILRETGLDGRFLELEITESTLMDGLASVNAVLHEFKRAGILISLDDFGTGYSSLSYLKRFPIDKLKIDQSFVHDVLTDVSDASLVRAVIAMARALRLIVIAEGVETPGQYEFLRADGCDELQGYHIARPMPAEQVPSFVARYNRR